MGEKKSRVVSLRLKEREASRLDRLARIHHRSIGETAALLLEEKLQEREFAFIEFRDSPNGRQACVKGTSLAVWEVALVGRNLGMNAQKIAGLLDWPIEKVQSALAYVAANTEEIDPIVEEVASMTLEQLQVILPWAREARS